MPSNSKPRSLFSLTCSACRDSKSVSVSVSSPSEASDRSDRFAVTTKTAPKDPGAHSSAPDDDDDDASATTPTFSGLLRQLGELERDVITWDPPASVRDDGGALRRRRRHRRCQSEGRVALEEESVAVVKESEDPLTDFRRSMLQMIVEKEILDGAELRELLRKFLELNPRRHHDVILRAFAEIWSEVFAGYEGTPDQLRRSRSCYRYRPR